MLRAILLLWLHFTSFIALSQSMQEDLRFNSAANTDTFNLITDFVSVVRDNNRVQLVWKVADSLISPFFSLERSSNGKDFEVVAVVKLSILNNQYEWLDESPLKGRNLYRVRYTGKNGDLFYSSPVSVQIDGQPVYKFYPNPVDNILIIRSDVPVDVQITDATGKVRISQSRVNGLQTINVSGLEKGIYLLRVTNKLNNGISQDKLIKN